jgi:hypothetical protein
LTSGRGEREVYGDLIFFCAAMWCVWDNKTFNNNQREKLIDFFSFSAAQTMASIKTKTTMLCLREVYIVSWVLNLKDKDWLIKALKTTTRCEQRWEAFKCLSFSWVSLMSFQAGLATSEKRIKTTKWDMKVIVYNAGWKRLDIAYKQQTNCEMLIKFHQEHEAKKGEKWNL